MLRHRPITWFFAVLLLLLLVLVFRQVLSYPWLFVVVGIYLTIEFFGAYFIGLNFHLPSLNRLKTTDRVVALSFDDGPFGEATEGVLNVLKRHAVKAHFFVIGQQIRGQEPLLRRIQQEGHVLGNHSYSHHFWFDLWSASKIEADLTRCSQAIEAVTGIGPVFFRPPYGVTTPNMARALRRTTLQSIGWSLRSYDTSIRDPEKILERILRNVKPGSIILLHDRLPFMPDLLDTLLVRLKAMGYTFVTLTPHHA